MNINEPITTNSSPRNRKKMGAPQSLVKWTIAKNYSKKKLKKKCTIVVIVHVSMKHIQISNLKAFLLSVLDK